MPRPVRQCEGGICYHVLNRGNDRSGVFHKPEDYQAFIEIMALGCERVPMRVLAYCLMPNHFHQVVWPFEDGTLSPWMQWLTTTHVRRYHRHYRSSGHVWQGRFKSFPVQSDVHLYTVLRYVERNPVRANLVVRGEAWEWSSLRWWGQEAKPAFLVEGPMKRPADWVSRVNRAETGAELEALRACVHRGRPYGSEVWQVRTAKRLGLGATLRPIGRPRLTKK
jgi:putative transposase